MCPCKDSDTLQRLKGILYRQIRWYKENQFDDGMTYDESWSKFLECDRGAFQEMLRLLSKE